MAICHYAKAHFLIWSPGQNCVQVASQDGFTRGILMYSQCAALLLSSSKQLKQTSKGLHSKQVTMLPLLYGGAGRN